MHKQAVAPRDKDKNNADGGDWHVPNIDALLYKLSLAHQIVEPSAGSALLWAGKHLCVLPA